MTDTPEINFDSAEFEGGSDSPVCTSCKKPLSMQYFQANSQAICTVCHDVLQDVFGRRPGALQLILAAAAGLAAAVVGAGIYWAVLALTGYEIGLIAIVVGFLVGAAVRWGSQGRGGLPFQLLAIALTYSSICVSYVLPHWSRIVDDSRLYKAKSMGVLDESDLAALDQPVNTNGARPTAPPNVTLSGSEYLVLAATVYTLSLKIPFVDAANNIIGLLIIGFALFEAWKINGKPALHFSGPYEIGSAAPGVSVADHQHE